MRPEFAHIWNAYWPTIWQSLNSSFATSVIGSIAGAAFGAYGGQRIVERGKSRSDLIQEIKDVNAAIMISVLVLETALSAKIQALKGMKERYDNHRLEYIKFMSDIAEIPMHKRSARFTLHGELRVLACIDFPVGDLKNIIFGKLSNVGAAVLVVGALGRAINSFNLSIERRNNIINEFKSGTHPIGPNEYFGVPDMNGVRHQEYYDLMNAIYGNSDSILYFSHRLISVLEIYGKLLQARYGKKFWGKPPEIRKVDYSKSKEFSLIPTDDDYPDWKRSLAEYEKKSQDRGRSWLRRRSTPQ